MADEEDPWGFDDTTDAPQESIQTTSVVETPKAGTPSATSAGVSAVGTARGSASATPVRELSMERPVGEAETIAPPPPPDNDGYRKPVQLYRHWVRPKFLQYKYMYNYRTNYYDDVIDYLDKKQVGVTREIPRPQTWAERVLRTNQSGGKELDSYLSSNKKNNHLIQTLAASIRTHNYHTKAYINQRYANVL